MFSHTFSQVGYDLRNLESKIDRKADQYEIHTLRSNVDSLEHFLREARAETDGLRSRVETLEESLRLIEQALVQEAGLGAHTDA